MSSVAWGNGDIRDVPVLDALGAAGRMDFVERFMMKTKKDGNVGPSAPVDDRLVTGVSLVTALGKTSCDVDNTM